MRGYLMRTITFLIAAFFLSSQAMAEEISNEEDLSRQELFSAIQGTDVRSGEYALPPAFKFPTDARDTSTFGVDFSHHVLDACKCEIDWNAVAQQKIKFIYFKATQGAAFIILLQLPTLQLSRFGFFQAF